MVIFSAFAMYGLREKRDTIADQEMEKTEGNFIDEKQEPRTEDANDLPPDSDLEKPSPKRMRRNQRIKSKNAEWIEVQK